MHRNPLPVTGAILSGGRGTRLFASIEGGDKALIDLAGQTLAAHVAQRLRPQVRALALNANGDPERFATLDLPVIADARPDQAGPLAGILSAMLWTVSAEPTASHVVTVPADTPFIPETLVATLWQAATDGGRTIAVASSRDRHHHAVALWPVALASSLAQALDDGVRAIAAFTDRHSAVPVAFADVVIHGDSIDPFFNINTPNDLAKARQLLASPEPNITNKEPSP